MAYMNVNVLGADSAVGAKRSERHARIESVAPSDPGGHPAAGVRRARQDHQHHGRRRQGHQSLPRRYQGRPRRAAAHADHAQPSSGSAREGPDRPLTARRRARANMFPENRLIEILIIGALALIVVGPKDLPVLMRRVGQFVGKMRNMAAEFRASFDELARQSELEDLRREVEAIRADHQSLTKFNPMAADLSSSGFTPPEESAPPVEAAPEPPAPEAAPP